MSWKAYMQSLPFTASDVEYFPAVGGTTYKLYAQKHNPFMYFSNIRNSASRLANIVPLARSLLLQPGPDDAHDDIDKFFTGRTGIFEPWKIVPVSTENCLRQVAHFHTRRCDAAPVRVLRAAVPSFGAR